MHVELRDKGDRGPLLFVNSSEYEELRRASSVDDVFLQNQAIADARRWTISSLCDWWGSIRPNLFTYMGVPPFLGREFGNGRRTWWEGVWPSYCLVIYFRQKQFAGNRNVVGQSIELSHKLYTVIGVTQPRFTWGDSDVYIPAMPSCRSSRLLDVVHQVEAGHKTRCGGC